MGASEALLPRYLGFLLSDRVEPTRHGLRLLSLKGLYYQAFRTSKGFSTASMVLSEEEVPHFLKPGVYPTRERLEALSEELRERLRDRFQAYQPRGYARSRNKRPWATLFRAIDAARATGLLREDQAEAAYHAAAALKEPAARVVHTYLRTAGWHDLDPTDAVDGLLVLLDVLTRSSTPLAEVVEQRFQDMKV